MIVFSFIVIVPPSPELCTEQPASPNLAVIVQLLTVIVEIICKHIMKRHYIFLFYSLRKQKSIPLLIFFDVFSQNVFSKKELGFLPNSFSFQ